jgi:hypothetical protein
MSNYAENSTFYNYPVPMLAGDTMTNWFVSHDINGNIVCNSRSASPSYCFTGNTLNVCWGNPGTTADSNAPAIEVSIYYETTPGTLSTIRIARHVFDPNVSRAAVNNFSKKQLHFRIWEFRRDHIILKMDFFLPK